MSTSSAARNRGLFEHRNEPLLPAGAFQLRLLRTAGACLALVAFSLLVGATGYRATEGLSWLDATLDAAMILTGMGQVSELHTAAGKVFAIVYALFSGVVFLSVVALALAPVAHRLLHAFHLEADVDD